MEAVYTVNAKKQTKEVGSQVQIFMYVDMLIVTKFLFTS